MIIRVFRAVVHDGRQQEFERFITGKALPLVKQQEGLVSVTVGRPAGPTPREFLMVTVWRDLDALKAFAGEKWWNPVVQPEEVRLLSETFLHHYESAAMEML